MLRPNRARLEIESLELEGPRDDEVLVRLVASGVCHTDIDFLADWSDSPVVLGHEGAGVVAAIGRQVTTGQARRSCRPLLPVLRPLPGMPAGAPHRLRPFLGGQFRFCPPGRQQCPGPKRRARPLFRPVLLCHPYPGHRTEPGAGPPGTCPWSSSRPWAAACRPAPAQL